MGALTHDQRCARIKEYRTLISTFEDASSDDETLVDEINDLKAWVNRLLGASEWMPRPERKAGVSAAKEEGDPASFEGST